MLKPTRNSSKKAVAKRAEADGQEARQKRKTAGTIGNPAAGSSSDGSGAGGIRFLTLFSVQFQHGFYNASQWRCADFKVEPTPACAMLMKQLGLCFRDRGDGFSVELPSSRLDALLSVARARGCWARLSFLLVLRNPAFVGITALPITTVPTQQGLFASNLKTTGLVLGQSAAGIGPEALYPVTGPTLTVVGAGPGVLTATDISGTPISPRATTALQAGQASTLDLNACAHGLYNLASEPASAYAGPSSLLYVPTRPLTSGLVDLLLTQPPGQGDAQAFPLHGDSLRPVHLRLAFAARQTYWHYYVVSQGGKGGFSEDLAISGGEVSFQRSAAVLPSGERAMLFTAAAPLPLRQRSPYRFTLTGQRHGANGGRDAISVSPLPTAPALPVWPSANGDPMSGSSEIYVYV